MITNLLVEVLDPLPRLFGRLNDRNSVTVNMSIVPCEIDCAAQEHVQSKRPYVNPVRIVPSLTADVVLRHDGAETLPDVTLRALVLFELIVDLTPEIRLFKFEASKVQFIEER